MNADTKAPLAFQVGGHAGVSTSEDGSLLIKPALTREVDFYQHLTSNPVFAPLRPYIPRFYGTLRFEGKLEDGNLHGGSEERKDKFLENLSHGFSKPNILDIKLGTKLYGDGAPEDKKARMIERAKDTTSLETGVRLTGFQVHDITTGQAVNTPKSYGRSIKASDLPDGIARFFPVHSEQSTQGLPKEQLLPVIKAVRQRVATIRDTFARLEIRMVGGSFLIIYESDIERVKQGIALLEEEGVEEADYDDEDEGSEDEDAENTKPGPPCLVKLIDFAHIGVVDGEGPDEGVLLGMDTTLKLLDGRIAQIKDS
ncbi:SAICAR synthase-like protein [Thelephora ganbajun]|uniref:SAICAR synthase-like protein n=1 Tax=Thelephora ganbajun TaxID=370292 RepID=A0ACB6ZWF3_THEGA|nr:SAICAR synthase-like protein [Thelephora ganbajun]